MFTGIVEEVGTVVELAGQGAARRLRVRARLVLEDSQAGASLAVSGACLTVVACEGDVLNFDLGPETLERTTLGRLGPGDGVNLERPLRLGATLGGHLVLGHVDGVAVVEALERVESTTRARIRLPDRDLAAWLVPQGSVAVDGVSLTVAALDDLAFEVMLVPHTLAVTTLGRLRTGSAVNVEADVIGKYVARSLALRGAR
ncbi:MAG: riboflavin synthase [Candidatus Rokubacteria bacterium]|nr:riboflavin synthase [Candidatus Rokubacteria bacterium]